MSATVTINNQTYNLVFNVSSGYWELETTAPNIGGVYDVDVDITDIYGNHSQNSTQIQVLKRIVETNVVQNNLAYFLDSSTLEIKDVKEFTNSYNFKVDEETNANSFINVIEKPNVENGDIIYIKRKKTSYLGIVSNITNGDDSNSNGEVYKITFKYISNIFDRKVILSSSQEALISSTGIEDFIAKVIMDEFTNSSDTFININWLTVTVKTHTPLQKSVDADDNGIYNFHTFITNCCQNYNIVMDYELADDGISIDIYKAGDDELQILDTTVSDITNYKEVFETSVTTKVVVKTDTDVQNFFLLSDRTVSEDIDDPDRAKGEIEVTYTSESSEARQTALDIFKGNTYNHNISFYIREDSSLFDVEKLKIGTPISIRTKNNIVYDTYISAIEDTNDIFLRITCGNMRIDFVDTILKRRKE